MKLSKSFKISSDNRWNTIIVSFIFDSGNKDQMNVQIPTFYLRKNNRHFANMGKFMLHSLLTQSWSEVLIFVTQYRLILLVQYHGLGLLHEQFSFTSKSPKKHVIG